MLTILVKKEELKSFMFIRFERKNIRVFKFKDFEEKIRSRLKNSQ